MKKTAVKKEKITRLQKSFQQTVIKLYRKKNVEEITINEVCAKVGVPRSSFYYHYNTIRDVLVEMEKDFLKSVASALKNINKEVNEKENYFNILELHVPLVKDNEQLIKTIIVERPDPTFLSKWSDSISNALISKFSDPLRKKCLAYTMILCITDLLATGTPIAKIKCETVYQEAIAIYGYKKELLDVEK